MRNMNLLKLLSNSSFLAISLIFTIQTVFGALTEKPEDVVAVVGSRVVIKCGTDLPHAVKWSRLSPGFQTDTDIFHSRGVLLPQFTDRFSVGNYSLVIENVTHEDAGQYTCYDEGGFGVDKGHFASAQLTVIGVPVCKHNIVESGWYYDNGCADVLSIKMACSVKCTGSGPVLINWYARGSDGKEVILNGSAPHNCSTNVTSSESIVVSEKVNQSVFTFSPQLSSSDSAINLTSAMWTSPRVIMKSFPEVMIIQPFMPPVKCLNENNNCTFMWRIPDGHVISVDNELTISSVPEMNVTGNITCTVYCPFVVNETCSKTLVVVIADVPKVKDSGTLLVFIAVPIAVCIVFTILCVVICCKRKSLLKICRNKNANHPEDVASEARSNGVGSRLLPSVVMDDNDKLDEAIVQVNLKDQAVRHTPNPELIKQVETPNPEQYVVKRLEVPLNEATSAEVPSAIGSNSAVVASAAIGSSASNLRPIIIDGRSVSVAHSHSTWFSARGIQIAIQYFRDRGHTDVKAFVPESMRGDIVGNEVSELDRIWEKIRGNRPDEMRLLERLHEDGDVIFTPLCRPSSDMTLTFFDYDRFLLDQAAANGGVIVSNDFGIHPHENNSNQTVVLSCRILNCIFLDDQFGPVVSHLRSGPISSDHILMINPPSS